MAYEDMGPQALKNIAEPMRAWRFGMDAGSSETPAKKISPEIAQLLALPDKPSIAVLPFQNMSVDPEQQFFADGIAEDVITALSRYPSLFVIARNSCFSFKGRAVDVKQVGRELGVRYVLEGSLRKSGNRVRVTAQLVEAETGNHIWAERYDRDLADIFSVQDEITQATTTAIARRPSLTPSSNERCASRRQVSMHGGPINAECGISARHVPVMMPLPSNSFSKPSISIRCSWGDTSGFPRCSAGQRERKSGKKNWQGVRSRSTAATQKPIPASRSHSTRAEITRAHALKPSGRWHFAQIWPQDTERLALSWHIRRDRKRGLRHSKHAFGSTLFRSRRICQD